MVHPIVIAAAPAVLPELAKRAPEIINNINPMTWFERVISDLRSYKLEKLRLEKEFKNLEYEKELALRDLEIKREVYLATLQEKRNTISKLNEPVMQQIKSHADTITHFQNLSQSILDKILSSDLPAESIRILLDMHKEYNNQIQNTIQAMQTAIDKNGDKLLCALEKADGSIPATALRRRLK